MIKLENITKVYSTDTVDTYALNNVNLEISDAEFLTICGPSGGGKSTLLSILGTHEHPNSGSYLFNDIDVLALKGKALTQFRRESISFIFQEFNLIDDLTVYENIALTLHVKNYTKSQVDKLVVEAMERLEIRNRASHFPNQLSGGQQQRVAIARSIVGRPKIIFADEPTGNLDTKSGQNVMSSLKQLNSEGIAICMVTHNQNYVTYGERVIQIRDGALHPYENPSVSQ